MKSLTFSQDREEEVPEPPKAKKNEVKKTARAELEAIIQLHVPAPEDQLLLNLLNKTNFWEAPASSKKQYHGCYPGGLADHTLLVLRHMDSLNNAWECGLDMRRIVLGAIIHDVAKAGFEGKPYYVESKGKDDESKYKYNTEMPSIGQNTMSMVMALKAGINLDGELCEAIMGQDGLFTEEGKSVFLRLSGKVSKLTYVLHFSDWYCSQVHGI